LTYVNFTGADLREADFTGAKIDNVNFEDANLDGAVMKPAGGVFKMRE